MHCRITIVRIVRIAKLPIGITSIGSFLIVMNLFFAISFFRLQVHIRRLNKTIEYMTSEESSQETEVSEDVVLLQRKPRMKRVERQDEKQKIINE